MAVLHATPCACGCRFVAGGRLAATVPPHDVVLVRIAP